MNTSLPLVTVIATCYNHERFALDCLESIRAQTYPNIQLIITDDSSTDHSAEIISDWIRANQIECHFICHTQNVGLTTTLNEVLEIATGEYIAVLATDDIWLPDFLSKFINRFANLSSDFGIVYGNAYVIDEEGNYLPTLRKRYEYHPEGYILKNLIKETFLTSCAVVMRKSYIEKIGFYNEDLCYEDFDLWTRLAEVCKFAYYPEILAKYRIVSTAMSQSRTVEMTKSTIQILTRLQEKYPETSRYIEQRKVSVAKNLYKLGYPRTYKYLFKYYLQHRSVYNFYLTLTSLLGMSYSTATDIWNFLRRNRGNQLA